MRLHHDVLSLTVYALGDCGVVTVVVTVVQVIVVTGVMAVVVAVAVHHMVRVGLGGIDVRRAEAKSVAGVEEPRLLRGLE